MYSDFGLTLGEHPRMMDDELNKLSVAILPLPGGAVSSTHLYYQCCLIKIIFLLVDSNLALSAQTLVRHG